MSGGRVELGLGAGWYDAEHRAYGIPFPPMRERFDRLEEQLEIVTGLWAADGPYSFSGNHYQLADSPALPKPVQRPRPPIIIGGAGPRRTPAIAARFADEFNVPFHPLAQTARQFERVREAAAGRDLRYSAAQVTCVGRDDAEVARRAKAIGHDPAILREHALGGTPGEVVDRIGRFAEAGATRLYLQMLDLSDVAHLELIASTVMPQL